MSDSYDARGDVWRPTCSIPVLRLRALMLRAIRQFFADEGYLEVETPLLSRDIVVDAHLDPFTVSSKGGETERLFLQTSPEAGMKRLLAADSGSIFQITRSFRRSERGQRHNSEFTIVEWYGVGTTYHHQMRFTEKLIHFVVNAVAESERGSVTPARDGETERRRDEGTESRDVMTQRGSHGTSVLSRPFRQTSYETAFSRSVGRCVLDAAVPELQALLATHTGASGAARMPTDRDELLNLLLAECVEPELGVEQPEFLCDYPVSQAALAERNPDDDRTACRFELYATGIELCNGYQELTDADELLRRESVQNASRAARAGELLPGARRMIDAMRSGLPRCSGVALGFDRLVMCMADLHKIEQVLAFPDERA